MNQKTPSVTDEIYTELVDGLKAGLDWTQFLAKHGTSKGPLYNAIGRFFNDMEPKVRALSEVQRESDQAGLKLDSLDQRIKEAEDSLAPLEDKRNALNEQIESLETRLAEKSEVIKQVGQLGKLGFDAERLGQLEDTLKEIGAKHGLSSKQAIAKFFSDLRDYDARVGFEREIQRLEAITNTKKLEAEKWQAEVERVERQHKELKEATDAMQALLRRGVKAEQIVSWNKIVSAVSDPKELEKELGDYKSIGELLNARKKELEGCKLQVGELRGQLASLKEHKANIEGAIRSLSNSGVKEIAKVSDKATAGLEGLSQEIVKETKGLLEKIAKEMKVLGDLKAEAGKLEKELMYARYLTAEGGAVLPAFPPELVFGFLDRVISYCKANEVDPIIDISGAYSLTSLSPVARIPLINLMSQIREKLITVLK